MNKNSTHDVDNLLDGLRKARFIIDMWTNSKGGCWNVRMRHHDWVGRDIDWVDVSRLYLSAAVRECAKQVKAVHEQLIQANP